MTRTTRVLLGLMVVAALCMPASAAITTVEAPVPGPINGGWNLMSLPAIPTNPAPPAVLDEYAEWLENSILRWDAAVQGVKIYSEWTPDDFGNLLLSEGYWLILPDAVPPAQLSFEGITDNDTTDMWISLPKAGWTIIGCPYSYSVDWNDVEITDGTVTIPLAAARDDHWLDTICWWWDSSIPGGALLSIGLDDEWTETTTLNPWQGYWVQSFRDNLALIVPAAN